MMNIIKPLLLTVPGEEKNELLWILIVLVSALLIWEIGKTVCTALKKRADTGATSVAEIGAVPPVNAPATQATPAADDAAIVAAITAAISAMLADEGYTGGFRVVSFKRRGTVKSKNL